MSNQLHNIYNYVKEKSTKNKWKSGLIGAAFFFFSGRYVYSKLHTWYYSLPPGPIGFIPLIGTTLSTLIDRRWHLTWAMQYGVVFSVYEFNKLTVYINDASIAKEVLSKSNTQDRTSTTYDIKNQKTFSIVSADDGTKSFLMLNGKKWFKMRQLMHSQLVRVMNTKVVNDIMNKCIKNELEPQLKNITNNNDNNIWYCREILSQLTFNIIFQANFGKNIDFTTNKLCKELAKDLVDIVGWNMAKRQVLLLLFPTISSLFLGSYLEPLYCIKNRIVKNIKTMVKYRKCNRNILPKIGDNKTFMDHTHALVEDDCDYTESQEIADIYLMFLAGTDTTSISTEWGLLLLSKQPDIQNKIRNELLSVFEKNNIDYINNCMNILYDIDLLMQIPLFRACIHEILRISCVARLGVWHVINNETNDIWINDKSGNKYRLPKGCKIRYNIDAIHNDVLGNENWKCKEYGLNSQQICLENWLKNDT
eukprot:227526_1